MLLCMSRQINHPSGFSAHLLGVQQFADECFKIAEGMVRKVLDIRFFFRFDRASDWFYDSSGFRDETDPTLSARARVSGQARIHVR
jgi:hypothetical protein